MSVDIFEIDVLDVNISALPQIGSLALNINIFVSFTKLQYKQEN